MGESDWNAEAEAMARYVAENLAHVARGAIPGRQSQVSIVFGNEGARDPQAVQDQVSRIRDSLDQAGIRVLGFGSDLGNEQTWAMVVESEDLALLNELVGAP
jgi:hypothetical protein